MKIELFVLEAEILKESVDKSLIPKMIFTTLLGKGLIDAEENYEKMKPLMLEPTELKNLKFTVEWDDE